MTISVPNPGFRPKILSINPGSYTVLNMDGLCRWQHVHGVVDYDDGELSSIQLQPVENSDLTPELALRNTRVLQGLADKIEKLYFMSANCSADNKCPNS